jgi:N-acetylmuramoyl-L-alanine amidase
MKSPCPQDILAKTIYGECRGEYSKIDGGPSALIAVGNVIINRLKSNTWFGGTLIEVCQKPYQFSCWNKQDPNYKIISQMSLGQDPIFDMCHHMAKNIMKEEWPDVTKGSNHYHSQHMNPFPKWAQGKKPLVKIGSHLFYKI